MGERTSTLVMRLIDGVSGPAGAINSALGKTTATTKGFATQTRGMAAMAGMLDTSMSKLGAMAGGWAAGLGVKAGVKAYADEERVYNRVAIRAGATREEIRRAQQAVYDIAQKWGVAEEEVQAGFAKMVKGSGGVEKALRVLPNAAMAAQAYGIEVGQAGKVTAALINQMKVAPDRVMPAWDMMDSAAKAGKIQMEGLAEHLPSLMTKAAMSGWKGEEGLRRLLTVLQAIAPQFNSTEEAVQALDDGLTGMHKKSVIAGLEKQGIDLPKVLAEASKKGQDQLEAFYNVLLKVSKGSPERLGELFKGGELGKFVYALKDAKDKVGLYRNIVGDTGATTAAANSIAKDTKSSLERLNTAWGETLKTIGRSVEEVGLLRALELSNTGINQFLGAIEELKKNISAFDDFMQDYGRRGEAVDNKLVADETARLKAAGRKRELATIEKQLARYRGRYGDNLEKLDPDGVFAPEIRKAMDRLIARRAEIMADEAGAQRVRDREYQDAFAAGLRGESSSGAPDGLGAAQSPNANRVSTPEGPHFTIDNVDYETRGKDAGAAIGQGIRQGLEEQAPSIRDLARKIGEDIKRLLDFNISPQITPQVKPMNFNGIYHDTPIPNRA